MIRRLRRLDRRHKAIAELPRLASESGVSVSLKSRTVAARLTKLAMESPQAASISARVLKTT
jgi:hypothetical protein